MCVFLCVLWEYIIHIFPKYFYFQYFKFLDHTEDCPLFGKKRIDHLVIISWHLTQFEETEGGKHAELFL